MLCGRDRWARRSASKSLVRNPKPLNWLPRHGTRLHADAADKFVRNLVKHESSQLCREAPSVGTAATERQYTTSMNQDPAKLSLSNFLAHETSDPLEPPPGFTHWMRQATFAVELYEPELLASADARTTIDYNGRPRSVINLCSYNYLGLANHPEVIAAAQEALRTHGLGACGSPMLSGMTDLHRELERQVAKFLGPRRRHAF